jgi:hypothetical protein
VGFDFDYYWTGNGSLISKAAGTGFGKTKDWAITFNQHKSLTVFQWYVSDSCPRVTISNAKANSSAVMLNGVGNEVAIKVWYEKEWEKPPIACNGLLPCTVTASQRGEYYLIKIKTEPNAVSGGELEAKCSNF